MILVREPQAHGLMVVSTGGTGGERKIIRDKQHLLQNVH